jgi:3-phosphoshikimate 1-carboxyvinyltransferase
MATLKITLNKSGLSGAHIQIKGSKSISNRVLLIQALSNKEAKIDNISNSGDTKIMQRLLKNSNELVLDAGDAGTAFRFLTAYLALLPAKHFLTGSASMLKRPISVLVDALNSIGAKITYSGKKGYPPLSIGTADFEKGKSELTVNASVSSQYISALLMIAPCLPYGLSIRTENKVVSEPYIDMTISLMQYFGANVTKFENVINIDKGKYIIKPYEVESDWSAASYFYAFAAIAQNDVCISIKTLYKNSLQGDSRIVDIMQSFGIKTSFSDEGTIEIDNRDRKRPLNFNYDFSNCPDLAQTLAVVCAALNVPALLSGLSTLKIKETDRIEALKIELENLGAVLDADNESISIRKGLDSELLPKPINTWNDHRMAMSFAPLVLVYGTLKFNDAEVVEKSYPEFWEDLKKLGISIK